MNLQLEQFTVQMTDGQTCTVKKIIEKDGVTLTVFRFCWTEENAERDDSFTVGWFQDVPGVTYKWDACCRLNRDLSPHWDDRFRSMLSSLSPGDLFPAYLRTEYVRPYALKALPVTIVWFKLCWEMLTKDYESKALGEL